MKDKQAFFDSSALIATLVKQDASARARQLLRRYPKPIIAWTTETEIHSALARLLREGAMDVRAHGQAMRLLAQLKNSWIEILPTKALRGLANDLLYKHELRAADSIQLASALVWCSENPRKRPFVTLDHRLGIAATDAGFNVLP